MVMAEPKAKSPKANTIVTIGHEICADMVFLHQPSGNVLQKFDHNGMQIRRSRVGFSPQSCSSFSARVTDCSAGHQMFASAIKLAQSAGARTDGLWARSISLDLTSFSDGAVVSDEEDRFVPRELRAAAMWSPRRSFEL